MGSLAVVFPPALSPSETRSFFVMQMDDERG
jgi:hypothetical protein